MSILHILFLALNSLAFGHAFAQAPPTTLLTKSVRHPPSSMMNTSSSSSWVPTTTTLPFGIGRASIVTECDNKNSRILSCMMVRGGGSDDDIDDEEVSSTDGEYDTSTDEETDSDEEEEEAVAVDVEVITSDDDSESEAETEERLERAQKHSQLSSTSRNFGIATALWASLFFDSMLNNSKRLELFPTAATTLVPTALLASGFGLAAGVAFLLWRDMEIRSDMIASDDGTSNKGDSMLALTSDGDDNGFASQTRSRLCLHLSLFGLLNLGAHAGYYFSGASAPFLGMSAVIINVHNTLTCVSAMRMEEGTKSLIGNMLMWPARVFQSKNNDQGDEKLMELSSYIFRLASIAAWIRSIPVAKSLLSLGLGLLSAGEAPAAIVNNSRQLSLKIASLARLSLVAGVSSTLFTAAKHQQNNKTKVSKHPFFAVLSGVLGLGCLSAGGAMVFDSFTVGSSVANVLLTETVGSGVLMALFGLFAGYNSVMGFTT